MLALTLSAVVVAGCGAFAGCNNNSDGGNKVPETQKIEDLFDDRYVNLYGRNYYNENYEGTTFINSASGFELKFCGTVVYANICVIGSNFDRIIVSDLSCDGAFIAAPEKPALNIEFYGDSITCGEGVLREYQPSDSRVYTAETQNALQAYTAYCASELGASFSVFGRGGITLKFKNAATEAFSVLDNYKSMAVDLLVAQGECPEYDFAVVPDAVVIYLGTNDYLRSLKYTTGYSLSGMQAALIEFVDKLGAYYGTDMPIVLCSGMMVHNSGLAGAVSGAAQTLKPKYPYIAALDFDAGVTESVGGHPVVEDSVKAGAQLAQTLKTLFENSGRPLD